MTLDDLLAREGIRDLVARYNSYGDTGKFELLWPLFADDAVMEVGPARGNRRTHTGIDEVTSAVRSPVGRQTPMSTAPHGRTSV